MKRPDIQSIDVIPNFRHFIHFVNIDPAKNRFRFCILLWQQDPWDHLSLVRPWGRIGTQGRVAAIPYSDKLDAQESVEKNGQAPTAIWIPAGGLALTVKLAIAKEVV